MKDVTFSPPPLKLLSSLLSVNSPSQVRTVASFLNKCLGIRSMYLARSERVVENAPKGWHSAATKAELLELEATLCRVLRLNKRPLISFLLLFSLFGVALPFPQVLSALISVAP